MCKVIQFVLLCISLVYSFSLTLDNLEYLRKAIGNDFPKKFKSQSLLNILTEISLKDVQNRDDFENQHFAACVKYFHSKQFSHYLDINNITYHLSYHSLREDIICYILLCKSSKDYSTIMGYNQVSFINYIPNELKLSQELDILVENYSQFSSNNLRGFKMNEMLKDYFFKGQSLDIIANFKSKTNLAKITQKMKEFREKLNLIQTRVSVLLNFMQRSFWASSLDKYTHMKSRSATRRLDLERSKFIDKTSSMNRNRLLHIQSACREEVFQFIGRNNHMILRISHQTFLTFFQPNVANKTTVYDDISVCLHYMIHSLKLDNEISKLTLSRSMRLLNNNARGLTQSGYTGVKNEVYSHTGLTGNGIIIGLSDTGIDEDSCFFRDQVNGKVKKVDGNDYFFDLKYRKVIQYIDFSGSKGDYSFGHGSHVAGSLAGNCQFESDKTISQKSPFNGVAFDAKIAFLDIGMNDKAQDLLVPADFGPSLFYPAYYAGARVHSNSWGGGYYYDAFCLETDRFLFDHPDFLAVFAGGNEGKTSSVLSPSISKNAISIGSVGNSNDKKNSLSPFSSRGPSLDGRIKPDILAPGQSITSARANDENSDKFTCATAVKMGTSMATPIASGNVALIQQYFKDPNFWSKFCDPLYRLCQSGPFNPPGSLVKAALLHSGEPLSGLTPNFNHGYGRIQLSGVLPLQPSNESKHTYFIEYLEIEEMSQHEFNFIVFENSSDLKATLSWYDPPNDVFVSKVLLHDLDLVLVDPEGNEYFGNGHFLAGVVSARDELNNNEQVKISKPSIGKWTIKVQSKLFSASPTQNYSIIVTGSGRMGSPIFEHYLNPSNFSKCWHITPGSSPSAPQVELFFDLFSKTGNNGWGNLASYNIIEVSSMDRVPLEHSGKFNEMTPEKLQSVCLPLACYQIEIQGPLSSPSKKSPQLNIPKCNLFLSPLLPKESFCLSNSYNFSSFGPNVSFSEQFESLKGSSCSTPCNSGFHYELDLMLTEDQGEGWHGTYYYIQPFRNTFLAEKKLNLEPRVISSNSMHWGFEETQSQCLPGESTDTCYWITMAIPKESQKIEENPQMFFLGAKLYGSESQDCALNLSMTSSQAKVCVHSEGRFDSHPLATITFYKQKAVLFDIGHTILDLNAIESMQEDNLISEIGKCQTILHAYSDSANEINDKVLKQKLDSKFENHSVECFTRCASFPGKSSLLDSQDALCKFMLDVYGPCDTYSLGHGLCDLSPCASECTVEDICYFGSEFSTSCPSDAWGSFSYQSLQIYSSCIKFSPQFKTLPATSSPTSPNILSKPFAIAVFTIFIVFLALNLAIIIYFGLRRMDGEKEGAQQEKVDSALPTNNRHTKNIRKEYKKVAAQDYDIEMSRNEVQNVLFTINSHDDDDDNNDFDGGNINDEEIKTNDD